MALGLLAVARSHSGSSWPGLSLVLSVRPPYEFKHADGGEGSASGAATTPTADAAGGKSDPNIQTVGGTQAESGVLGTGPRDCPNGDPPPQPSHKPPRPPHFIMLYTAPSPP